MRPVLFSIPFGWPLSLGLLAAFVAVAVVQQGAGVPLARALLRALVACLTCGLGVAAPSSPKGEHEPGADLFVPGALGTLLGALPLAWALASGPFEVPVSSYPFMLSLGFVVGISLIVRRARARGIPSAHVIDIAIICLVAGPVGARAFFVAQFWGEHFSDRPARVVIGEARRLAPGDELVVSTPDGTGRVVFGGDEATLEQVSAKLEPLRVAAGVTTRLILLERRRTGDEILRKVRGLSLETTRRGPGATLSVAGGAARKLGVEGERAEGLRVPWTEGLKLWNGGIVFYGGLLLATAAGLVYVAARGHRLLAVADVIAPVLALGMAFGRTGCTLNGCCWGREVEPGFPLGVRFPVGSFAWLQHVHGVLDARQDAAIDACARAGAVPGELGGALGALADGSYPVHPVQLYDIVLEIALFSVVTAFGRYVARREGQTFFFYFIAYGFVRFTLEHFRGDHSDFSTLAGYPMTVSQRVALGTVVAGAAALAWVSARGRMEPRDGAVVSDVTPSAPTA